MFHVERMVFSLCMPIMQACENAMGTISENCRALVARQLLQRRMERLKIYLAHKRLGRMREVFFRSAYKNCLGYVLAIFVACCKIWFSKLYLKRVGRAGSLASGLGCQRHQKKH